MSLCPMGNVIGQGARAASNRHRGAGAAMSSKFTGDAQPDAGPGTEPDQTLPTEIVANQAVAGAGAVRVTEGAEPTAESGTAESEPAPEPAAEPAPDEPTAVMDAAGPGDDAAAAERLAGAGGGGAQGGD